MAENILFIDQGMCSSGFERPERLLALSEPLREICRPLRSLLQATPELESVNIRTDLFPWAEPVGLMGWEVIAFALNERDVCLALQDVNGITAGYQAELPPGWWGE